MPFQRRDTLPLRRALGHHIDITVFIVGMLGAVNSLCCVRHFLPDADGRVEAGGSESAPTGTPGDASDRTLVGRRDLGEELKDRLGSSGSGVFWTDGGRSWKVVRV